MADKAVAPLLSDEHFSVDGTLIQAWASMKSFQPREAAADTEPPAGGDTGPGQDGNGPTNGPQAAGRNTEVDFHGEKRSNDTHARAPIPRRAFIATRPAKKPGFASWAMG